MRANGAVLIYGTQSIPKNGCREKNMARRISIGFMSQQHVCSIPSQELQRALSLHEHCVLVEGSMAQFKQRINLLGIEVTRGDGLHFTDGGGKVLFPKFFIYEEFEVDGVKYLRFGLGNSLYFAVSIDKECLASVVRHWRPPHVMKWFRFNEKGHKPTCSPCKRKSYTLQK